MMSEDLVSSFFSIGKIFPFYYGVRGARGILFGSLMSKGFEDALVVFGWLVGCFFVSFLIGFTNIFKRWKKIHDHFLISRFLHTGASSRGASAIVMG